MVQGGMRNIMQQFSHCLHTVSIRQIIFYQTVQSGTGCMQTHIYIIIIVDSGLDECVQFPED